MKKSGRKILKKSKTFEDDDVARPVWFDMPPSFFERLNKVAERADRLRRDVLLDALEKYDALKLYEPRETPISLETLDIELAARKYAAENAKKNWKKISPKARKEHAAMMAQKRWGTDRNSDSHRVVSPSATKKTASSRPSPTPDKKK